MKTLANQNYKVSTKGDVYKYSHKYKEWKKRKAYLQGQGKYKVVSIDGRNIYLHKLVFMVYNNIHSIPKGMQIDHIDNNHHNNHFTNLRMITKSENTRKAMLRSQSLGKINHKHLEKKVRMKDIDTGKVKTYKSITDTSKKLGIPSQSIIDNLKGRTKVCKKTYKAKYA